MKAMLSILLLLGAALLAAEAIPAIQVEANNIGSPAAALKLSLQARSAVEQFTLGAQIAGAVPIYSYTNTINYDAPQEIIAEVSYPSTTEDVAAPAADAVITQIEVHVEGSDGMDCQAYVLSGGIGEKSLTLQLLASNTNSLRYVVIVYGTKV